MSTLGDVQIKNIEKYREIARKAIEQSECIYSVYQCAFEFPAFRFEQLMQEKEEPTMQVSYNGFTGELVKLERHSDGFANEIILYDISIYDSEKKVTHSFTGVKLKDVKFLGGAVSFCG